MCQTWKVGLSTSGSWPLREPAALTLPGNTYALVRGRTRAVVDGLRRPVHSSGKDGGPPAPLNTEGLDMETPCPQFCSYSVDQVDHWHWVDRDGVRLVLAKDVEEPLDTIVLEVVGRPGQTAILVPAQPR
uniref:Uncharacterized protein n=1 Tax=uncultured prokaryote TaxID=198431 RepID=A0A0H5Q733_9ZZZZ|nr:hypothetical protein [uncultured prokaryote]